MDKQQYVQIPVEDFDRIMDSLRDGLEVAAKVNSTSDNPRNSYPYVAGYSWATIDSAIKSLSTYEPNNEQS